MRRVKRSARGKWHGLGIRPLNREFPHHGDFAARWMTDFVVLLRTPNGVGRSRLRELTIPEEQSIDTIHKLSTLISDLLENVPNQRDLFFLLSLCFNFRIDSVRPRCVLVSFVPLKYQDRAAVESGANLDANSARYDCTWEITSIVLTRQRRQGRRCLDRG